MQELALQVQMLHKEIVAVLEDSMFRALVRLILVLAIVVGAVGFLLGWAITPDAHVGWYLGDRDG